MKNTVVYLALILALVCSAPAFAQWVQQATVTVPFAFDVGRTTLPVGTYAILTRSEGHAIQLKNVETGASAYFVERDIVLSSGAPETKLIFRQDGTRRVLHQVQLLADDHTHDLAHGKEILELAQNAH